MQSKNIIDLTQDSDDSDDLPIPPYDPKMQNQNKNKIPSFPIAFKPNPTAIEHPFDFPLINTAHSVAYAFSNSTIDPFSNLIRLLHQNSDIISNLFFPLTQALAFNARPVEFYPILIELLETKEPQITPTIRHLTLQSLTILSINDSELCRKLLEHIPTFINCSQESDYLLEVFDLFISIGEYAEENDAKKIIDEIYKKKYYTHLNRALRAPAYSIFAVLSKHGNIFPNEVVDEIQKKICYPGGNNKELAREIVYPCLVCLDSFLKQSESLAYSVIKSIKNLHQRIALTVILCEHRSDPEFQLMILKVFLEICNEFQIDELTTIPQYFNVASVLIYLQNFAAPPVRKMADMIIKHFNIENTNLQPESDLEKK